LYIRSDAILLKQLRADGDLLSGIYAAAFRLFDGYSQIAVIISGVLLPVFSAMLQRNENLLPVLKASIWMLVPPAVLAAATGFFFPGQIVSLLYREHLTETADALSMLLAATIPFSFSLIAGTLLTAQGSLRQLIFVAGLCVALCLISNFLLIPGYGVQAPVRIAVFIHGISAIFLLFYTRKILGVFPEWSFWFKLFLAAACIFGCVYMAKAFGTAGLIIAGAVFASTAAGLAFRFRTQILKKLGELRNTAKGNQNEN
jgi:O-antigen/teichoic acid export membrane protein